MKTPLSFLFFVLIFLLSFSIQIKAQQPIDSTTLYGNAISNPQKQSNIPIDKAIKYFENLRNRYLSINDTISAITCTSYIAQGHYSQGHEFESEMSAIEGFKLLDKIIINDRTIPFHVGLSNHMGMLHRKKNDYKGAIKYYERALKFSTSLKDSLNTFNNISNILIEKESYLLAVKKLEYTFNKAKSLSNYPKKWRVLDNWGYALFKLGAPDALSKMELALQKKLEKKDLEGTFSSYIHLTDYYIHFNDSINAKILIEKAKTIAKDIGSDAYLFEAISRQLSLSDNVEVQFFKRYIDSITQLKRENDKKYAYRKYENEKLEKERIKTQLNLEKQKKKNAEDKSKSQKINFLAIIGVLISVFIIFYYKQRNRLEKDRERHRTERALSKKVHDEVGNDLFYLMAQIQSNPHEFLEQNGLKLLDGLNEIYGKARDISKHYTAVHTGPNYNNELLSLLNSYGSDQIKIITNKIDPNFWETVEPHKKENLYRILQELLTNMKKHSNANFVAVTFTKDAENIHVKYVDNGCGVDLKTLTLKNGLDNVESRMVDLKGSITFESVPNKGFKAFIKLST
jgi:signal transduction histidine kinase